MGNKVTQWHAELHKEKDADGAYKCIIYNDKEHLVDEVKATKWETLIDEMREAIVRNVRIEFGENAGHELSYSSEVGENIFDIPISIIDMSKPVVGSGRASAQKDEDTDERSVKTTQNTNVSFTPIAPSRAGYYFYSIDGKQSSLMIVKVDIEKENGVIAYEFDAVGAFPIDDFDKDDALWSKNPIKMPAIDANQEKPVVDHEDW